MDGSVREDRAVWNQYGVLGGDGCGRSDCDFDECCLLDEEKGGSLSRPRRSRKPLNIGRFTETKEPILDRVGPPACRKTSAH